MKNKHSKAWVMDPNRCIVFFDFDNTISTCDVFDDMVIRFSRDKRWIDLEKRWREGKIGSMECLAGQLEGIRITKRDLDKHLSGIRLDPYFKRLVHFLEAKRVKKVILSDNFDYILKRILSHNSLKELKIYSNRLQFAKDRLIPRFPFRSKHCGVCAHCKTKNLLANVDKDSIIIYVGDGNSDICPAEYADIIFAKENLLRYCKRKKLNCLEYNSLREVYEYLRRSLI